MTITPGSQPYAGKQARPIAREFKTATTSSAIKDAHLRAARSPQAGISPERREKSFGVSVLLDDGSITDFDHRAPADLFLEDICANVARGTVISTKNGGIAVEDLRPGDRIKTRDDGYKKLRWIGSCTLNNTAGEGGDADNPLRIRADALGPLRPVQDLLVSPRFRILTNHPSCAALFGSSETLAPAVDLLDGDTIMRVHPAQGLTFYNLMFDRHQIIEANGLETESYHPGNFGVAVMSLEMQAHLRQLLPHLNGNLDAFGRTVRPVLKGFEAEVLRIT